MAGRHLREAGRARQPGQAALLRGVFPGMHQHDRHGGDAVGPRGGEGGSGGGLVQRLQLLPVHIHPSADLHHPLVQHRGQANGQVEQPGPGLVADAQQVGEAAVDHQQGALAAALQQRVGGHRGAHLHRLHQPRRDRRRRRQPQHGADAGQGCVAVAAGIDRQQLVRGQASLGVAGDDVGEGAAAVDPELPACHVRERPVRMRGHATPDGRAKAVFCPG